MMTFKKKWISILASAMAFVLCCTLGVIFALDTKKVSAETASEYETYDVLYTDDFSIYTYPGKVEVENNGSWTVSSATFLNFTPSAENTSASYVWRFQYKATDVASVLNIYPLASGNWGGARAFNWNDLPDRFTVGQTYDIEFGVIKIKNSDKYQVFVNVDGVEEYNEQYTPAHNTTNNQCTANGCSQADGDFSAHTGIYFTGASTGTCSSNRPETTVDRLTNSDWKLGGKTGTAVPTEWEWNAAVGTNAIQYIDFTPSAENTSASFIWEFDFLCTTAGKNFNIYPFAGGTWPGGTVVDVAAYYGENGFTAGEIYKIEVGVVLVNERLNDYRFYVAIDGVEKYGTTLKEATTNTQAHGDGLSIYFNGACRGILVGVEDAVTPDTPVEPEESVPVPPSGYTYETYDVLTNSDWTLYYGSTLEHRGTMPANWSFQNGYFMTFTPSAENTTASFIWKFKYTVTSTDDDAKTGVNIYPLASGYYGANRLIDFNKLTADFSFEKGKEYDIEFGVLKLVGNFAGKYRKYVKVGDQITYDEFWAAEHHATNCTAVNNCDGSNLNKHTGMYIYVADTNYANSVVGKELTDTKPTPPAVAGQKYEAYDVLDNADWTEYNGNTLVGTMPKYWSAVNGKLIKPTLSDGNTTGSFIWKFKYTHLHDDGGAMNIYPLAGAAWGADALIDFRNCGFTLNQEYDIEFGVLKISGTERDYYVYVMMDGVVKIKTTITMAHNGNCGCQDTTDYSKHTGMYLYFPDPDKTTSSDGSKLSSSGLCAGESREEEEGQVDLSAYVDTYDVLYNQNWTVLNSGAMGDNWTLQNDKTLHFTPSTENTTGSFIWKYRYTHNKSGVMRIYTLANGAWGGKNETIFQYGNCGFEVGKTYDVEFCVLKVKDDSNYEVFAIVDGVKGAVTTIADTHKNGNDLYLYFDDGANGTITSPVDIMGATVENYDVLYNQNWALYDDASCLQGALPKDWALTSTRFINFTPSENNTTASFVWKFQYTQTAKGDNNAAAIFPLSAGIGGGQYIDFKSLGLTNGTTYDLELGVLKIVGRTDYYVFVKVNDVIKYEGTFTRSHIGNCTGWNCTDAECSNHTGIYFYLSDTSYKATFTSPMADGDIECGAYDVLYNSDWSVTNGDGTSGGAMSSTWADVATDSNGKFISFTPSKGNTTSSFIWKFNYTPSANETLNVFPLASYLWGAAATESDGTTATLFNLNSTLTPGTTYAVELCVMDVLYSNDYYVLIKVNGEIKYQRLHEPTHNTDVCKGVYCSGAADDYSAHTGIYFYMNKATGTYTFEQEEFTVTVNGEEQLVEKGTTVLEVLGGVSGLLPADRPNGYTVTWQDAYGNKLNANTQITSNVTLVPAYTYTYTIFDANGDTLYTHEHLYGTETSYNSDALTVDRNTFTGYLVGDTLYKDLASAVTESAKSGKNVVANTVTLGLVDGASIRLDGEPSIRFTATVDKSKADAGTQIVDFGMLLTTKATLHTITDFTIDGLALVDDGLYYDYSKGNGLLKNYEENRKYPGQYVYSLIFSKVSKANYGVQYVARAYAVVQYADGTQEVVYSEFDEAEHTRSMYEVANAAIGDYKGTAFEATVQQHIDGIIYLDDVFDMRGEARNYTVRVSEPIDGEYTVTVTAKNGFDLKNIGAIYVEGEKIPTESASLSGNTGTFVIQEANMSAITLKKFNDAIANVTAKRELTINAYSGPSLGLKINSSGAWVDSGYDFTLADLETYMAAGFDAWRLEISPYTGELGYTAKGTVVTGGSVSRDIYMALDLAAQYAQKYKVPCKVYVNIPEVTGLVASDEGIKKIQDIYNELTNYDDGITKNLTGVKTVNGKNQIAGFLLMDEPMLDNAQAFEYIFKLLNNSGDVTFDSQTVSVHKVSDGKKVVDHTYTLSSTTYAGCGAGDAGYDYQIALLQNYADSKYIGSDFDAYVSTYAEILKEASSIGFDSYPFGYEKVDKWIGSDTEEYTFKTDWFPLMEKYSGLDNGFTACIQSYIAGASTSGTLNKTTKYNLIQYEAEISMLVYISLAYGYTDLDYFTYTDRIDYDRQVTAEIYQDVPVQWNDYSDWTKGYTLKSMYDWMKNVNGEASSLYEVLGKFTKTGVQLITGSTTNNIFGSAKTTNTTNAITVSSTYDMVVGGFKCDSYNGYLAVNADLPTKEHEATEATFTLGTQYTKAIVYKDGVASVERITNGALTMKVGAGEGVFIVPLP